MDAGKFLLAAVSLLASSLTLAGPFCTRSDSGKRCDYPDQESCRRDAEALHGGCSIDFAQVDSAPGDAPLCVVSGSGVRCEYLDLGICMDAAAQAAGACIQHHRSPALKPNSPVVAPAPGNAPGLPQALPAQLVPAVVDLTDGPGGMATIGFKAQQAYGSGRYSDLDTMIEGLSQPLQLADDGRARVSGVLTGLGDFMEAWNTWHLDLQRIADWRKEQPDSYAVDVIEAQIWREWAWQARGAGYASTVAPEGWKLFSDRLAKAQEILSRSKPRASRTPLWYILQLEIGRDMQWRRGPYEAVFREATLRFPTYVPFYLAMGDYLSPKWGGSYEAVDEYAKRMVVSRDGKKDHSMYSRIYWNLSQNEGIDTKLFEETRASWPIMKLGFEDLMERHPKSQWNLNAFAGFACLAQDAPTYAMLRVRIGPNLMNEAWASNHPPDVCDERLLRKI